MVQDSTTYYVWIGGSCDYGHKEPTHEGRAETKLVWSLPCKKEEDEAKYAANAMFLKVEAKKSSMPTI